MATDGADLQQISTHPGFSPVPSPDGNWILFRNTIGSNDYLYRMAPDGATIEPLDKGNPVSHANPIWSPDSQWIYFLSERDYGGDIYRMQPDGSNIERLTNFHSILSIGKQPPVALTWHQEGYLVVSALLSSIVTVHSIRHLRWISVGHTALEPIDA